MRSFFVAYHRPLTNSLRVIIASVLLLYAALLCAQNELFHAYTIQDGLPENTANALMQDAQGRLWIGTQAGVVMFDGARFITLGTEGEMGHRLSNNMVEGLYEDANGMVYIGTRNGMNVYNPLDQQVTIHMPDPSASFGNNICRMGFYEDSTSVWFISKYSLNQIDKSSHELKTVATFAPNILGVMQAYDEGLLISADSILLYYDIQNQTSHQLTHLSHNITALSFIDGRLWIGTLEGIFDLDGKAILADRLCEAVLYIGQSSDGRVWIGTTDGIALYAGDSLHRIRANDDTRLEGSLQLSFLEDRQKHLWFGSNAALNRLVPRSESIGKNRHNQVFALPSSQVNSIAYAETTDLIAFGTENGVNISQLKIDTHAIIVLGYQNFLAGTPINFTGKDASGSIWVGTKSGEVHCFDAAFRHFKLNGRIKGIRGFYEDTQAETIYIAGSEGVFAAGPDRVIYKPDWLSEIKYTVSLFEQENGFWVSHSDMIYSVDLVNKKIAVMMAGQDTIPSYMITNQLKTDSCIWFSSISGGVFSYRPATHSWAGMRLLKGKNVWSTYADEQGRLWSNTDDGLYIHNGRFVFQKLDADDGLNYNDFTMTAHAQLKNGMLIYGNKKGISMVNPHDFAQETWSATPYFSQLEINFKREPLSKLNGQLVLEPDEKSITLFVGLDDFQYAKGAEMRYKLEKLNASWSGFQPVSYPISLNGLSAGDYTLVVSIRDKSGRLSDRVLTQQLRMLPYFYETSLFKLVVLLLLVVVLVFVASFRARQKQKAAENKLKTEQAIGAERERISRDLHDSIGARLTKIVSDMDIMELQLEHKQQAVSMGELAKTRDYTQDTINKLRETIWTLDAKIVRLQDVFHQTKAYIERYLPDNISFDCHMDDALLQRPINPEVAVNIFRILQELTQNMLKYSKATSFSVHFSSEKNVKLTVWDNGIGFDFQAISKGEGLKNIQRRLKEIKGRMDFERGNGSKFIIHFN